MFNDYYLIKRIEKEKEEGLTFAKSIDDFAFTGEIVKVPYPETNGLTIGDHVMFLKDTGDDVEYKGEMMKIVNGKDLIMQL